MMVLFVKHIIMYCRCVYIKVITIEDPVGPRHPTFRNKKSNKLLRSPTSIIGVALGCKKTIINTYLLTLYKTYNYITLHH